MLSSYLVASFVLGYRSEPKDFVNRAARMENLVSWLSQETGEDVRVVPELKNHVVLVKVSKKTPDQVYGYIAKALDCDWQRGGGVVSFYLSQQTVARKNAAVYESRLAKTKKMMESLKIPKFDREESAKLISQSIEMAKKTDAGTYERYKEIAALEQRTPDSVACIEFLQALGMEGLASIEPGSRVVFSTNPTRLQRPWPRAAANVLSNWEANAKAVDEARRENKELETLDEESTWQFSVLSGDRHSGEAVTSCHVIISPSEWGLNVMIQGYDSEGNQNAWANLHMNYFMNFEFGQEPVAPKNPYEEIKEMVVMTEEDRLNQTISKLYQVDRSESPQIPKEVLEVLASCADNEPLSFGASSALLRFSEIKGQDIVCQLGDFLMFQDFGKVSIGEFAFLCTALPEVSTSEVLDGVLVARPDTDSINLSRHGLARLAKGVLAEGQLSIDTAAEALLFEPDDQQAEHLLSVGQLLSGTTPTDAYGNTVLPLRVYGSLSQADKAKVKSGSWKLPLNSCSPSVRALVESYFLREELSSGEMYGQDEENSHEGQEIPAFFYVDRNQEQTVFLAHASSLPIMLDLSMLERGRLLSLQSHDDFSYTTVMSEQSVAESIYWSRRDSGYGQPGVYAPIQQGVLKLTIQFGELTATSPTYKLQLSRAGKFKPWEELDAETKGGIMKHLEKVTEQMKGVEIIGGGRKQPPPAALN